MNYVYLQLSRARDPIYIGSSIIAESEKRNYSHASTMYLSPTTNREFVFQASHGKVNLQDNSDFLLNNILVKRYRFNPDDETMKKLLIFINANLGKPYSRVQIIILFFKKLLQVHKWPTFIYNLIKNGDKEEICSELDLRVFEILHPDFEICESLQVDQFTPSDLDTLLTNYGIPCEAING